MSTPTVTLPECRWRTPLPDGTNLCKSPAFTVHAGTVPDSICATCKLADKVPRQDKTEGETPMGKYLKR